MDGQHDWHRKEPLFGGSVLCTVVYLFPKCHVAVGIPSEVAFERHAGYPVEHEIRELESAVSRSYSGLRCPHTA